MKQKLAIKMLEQVKNNYNSIAPDFSQTRSHAWPEFKCFSKYLKKGDKVLDLACGNGRLLDFLKDYEVDYLGMDNAEKLLNEAVIKFLNNKFIHGDLLNIPVEDNSFDKVFCIAALHHLPNEKLRLKALWEIKRVLKKDGVLILTVWNLFQPKYKFYFKKAFWKAVFSFGQYAPRDLFIPWGADKKINRYYYAFKFDELKRLIIKAGFKIIEEIKEGFNFCIVARPVKEVEIMGVRLDILTNEQALNKVKEFVESESQYYGVTPNPEIILAAQKDRDFLRILNSADLKIADGIGLVFASKGKLSERVSGADLMMEICKKMPVKVFLLGAEEGIAEKAKEKMISHGYKAKFAGTYSGSPKDNNLIEIINKAKPEILFVAFGAPNQEKWIYENLKKMPTVKFAMGVGGAFDFISGKIKRAPVIFRKLGLEWLFRLINQPFRIKRIYNAVARFPMEILKNEFFKLINNF